MSYSHFDDHRSRPDRSGSRAFAGLKGAVCAKPLVPGEVEFGIDAVFLQLMVLVLVLLSVLVVVDVVIIELIGSSA